ncbi:MAG TPA: hypothetical protein VGL64_24940 [Amycolatopsis sp.]|jgi:hypothetical protein
MRSASTTVLTGGKPLGRSADALGTPARHHPVHNVITTPLRAGLPGKVMIVGVNA